MHGLQLQYHLRHPRPLFSTSKPTSSHLRPYHLVRAPKESRPHRLPMMHGSTSPEPPQSPSTWTPARTLPPHPHSHFAPQRLTSIAVASTHECSTARRRQHHSHPLRVHYGPEAEPSPTALVASCGAHESRDYQADWTCLCRHFLTRRHRACRQVDQFRLFLWHRPRRHQSSCPSQTHQFQHLAQPLLLLPLLFLLPIQPRSTTTSDVPRLTHQHQLRRCNPTGIQMRILFSIRQSHGPARCQYGAKSKRGCIWPRGVGRKV